MSETVPLRSEEQADEMTGVTPSPAPASAPRATPRAKGCTCGHHRTAHQHHRRGTDCALCGCAAYEGPLKALLARLR
jgi:hypothetical protein